MLVVLVQSGAGGMQGNISVVDPDYTQFAGNRSGIAANGTLMEIMPMDACTEG